MIPVNYSRLIVTVFFACTGIALCAQDVRSMFEKVKTKEDAINFAESNPGLSTEIYEFNSLTDSTDMVKKVMTGKPGETMVINGFLYGIADVTDRLYYRAGYIQLNGNILPAEHIDSLGKVIISRYKAGTPFGDLEAEYSDDWHTRDNVPDWYTEGMMEKEFEAAVEKHNKDDLFTVDVAENKQSYIVLKTSDHKRAKIVTVIRVKYP